MSDFKIETPEERRGRYLRLAHAATEAAAKTPLPAAKSMYLRLAEAWRAMAEEHDHEPNFSYDAAEIARPRGHLHPKLKESP